MKTPLNQLPEPKLIDSNYEETLGRLRNNYQEATEHYPSTNDVETFQLEQLAYEREILVDEINNEGRQNLLAYAKEERLDNIGVLVDCERLKPTSANAMFEFVFKDGHSGFVIPAGYRVIAQDGKTIFTLLANERIEVGATSKLIALFCTKNGSVGNGFFAGDISQIANSNENIISVSNVTLSMGGSDKESDDSYRHRIYLAPSAFSSAGPFDAYEYFARSAHQDIIDVTVLSPEPNTINIYILLKNQQVPSSELLRKVESICNDKKRRPIGDVVRALAAEPYRVTASAHLKIYTDMQSMAQSAIEKAEQEITKLTESWQRKLGKDIVPQALTSPLQVFSAVYLATTSLEFHALAQHQYPVVTIENLTYEIINETTE